MGRGGVGAGQRNRGWNGCCLGWVRIEFMRTFPSLHKEYDNDLNAGWTKDLTL